MKELSIEIIGVEPPCDKCRSLYNVVREVVSTLKSGDLTCRITKVNSASPETLDRYGLLLTPALAINGIVRVMGRVPTKAETKKIINEINHV